MDNFKTSNCYISVGEPWDFESLDGKNITNGTVLKIISSSCLIFKSNHILNLKDVSGDILIVKPRHSENDFSDLENKDGVTINGLLLTSAFNEHMEEKELEENSSFVIIGSIHLV